ncbi:MAG: hypothetical protein RL277_2274 [Planctomycetota bacterium]|jgi:hypothetical protein
MSATSPQPDPQAGQPTPPAPDGRGPAVGSGKSYGNMGPEHWSRARADANAEELAYYRSRNEAPGVHEGGKERNFWCMQCSGVIPFDHPQTSCPHCGASLEERAKRYYNWVEINEPPRSDFAALLPILIPLLLCIAAFVLWAAGVFG